MHKSRSGSKSTIRKPVPVRLGDLRLESALENELDYLNILAIREELIEEVLDECEKAYMKKQSVKFIIGCLHDAYIDIFNTIHMFYDQRPVDRRDLWQPDTQCEPLPLDNYAEFSVRLENSQKEETKSEVMPMWVVESRSDDSLSNVFYRPPPVVSETVHETAVPAPSSYQEGKELPSMYAESYFENVEWAGDQEEMKATYTTSSSELYQEISSETSFFTGVAEAHTNFLPKIEETRCDNPLVRSVTPFERMAVASMTKRPVGGVLPPLRLRGRFKSTDEMQSATSSMKAASSTFKVNKALMGVRVERKMKEKPRQSADELPDEFPHKVDDDTERIDPKEDSSDSDH